MTAYYILAVSFGLLAVAVSLYGMLGPGKKGNFPGALAAPLMLVFFVLGVATLTALTIGAGHEDEEHEDKKGESAALIAPRS